VTDGRNLPYSNRAPRSIGAPASRLMKLIDGSHHKARLSEQETRLVRFWIETGATYPGTYASLGCGMYDNGIPADLLKDRCGSCHGRQANDEHGRRYVVDFQRGTNERLRSLGNLSRPEKSTVLRAPLVKEAGGLGLCKEAVFRDAADPLYREMLRRLADDAARLQRGKRFDMPGFRPNEHYVREMKRFGILPAELTLEAPIDPYATDRAYWDSFDYRPVQADAEP
jgi:hypothetical protein